MIVNVPSQVILAEIVVVFVPAADDGVERVQTETLRLAQLPAQSGALHAAAQRPDGVNKWQPGHLIPRRAQVPDVVLTRRTQKINRRIANQQRVIRQSNEVVTRQRFELRPEPALSEQHSEQIYTRQRRRVAKNFLRFLDAPTMREK